MYYYGSLKEGYMSNIKLFENKKIRAQWNADEEEWYFSVVDVVDVLTGSKNSRRYWSDLKRKLIQEGSEVYEKIVQLKLQSQDGKRYETDCLNTKGILRLIQSIPSPKAEPFKMWLAQVGSERLDEIADPQKAVDRAIATYRAKGYSEEWIKQRIFATKVRKELTDEWSERGVKESKEYAILTDEMTKAWSGMTVKEYKDFKNLKKENLRDNMTDIELVLNMLAEVTTTAISKSEKPNTFDGNVKVAKTGGKVAKNTRDDIESKLNKTVISPLNADDPRLLDTNETKEIDG